MGKRDATIVKENSYIRANKLSFDKVYVKRKLSNINNKISDDGFLEPISPFKNVDKN